VTALAYNIQGGVSDIIIPETINPLDPVKRSLGEKQYELSNHLGNVLVTVSDRKLAEGTEGSTATGYRAEVLFASDYYPFGMQMPGRQFSAEEYRYGYQGSEKDNEIAGEGNMYTTHFRALDTRIGRWLSIDPAEYIGSPYSSMANNPILMNDMLGDTTWNINSETGVKTAINGIGGDEQQIIYYDGIEGEDGSIQGGEYRGVLETSSSNMFIGLISRFDPKEDDYKQVYGVSDHDLWTGVPEEYLGHYSSYALIQRHFYMNDPAQKRVIELEEELGIEFAYSSWGNSTMYQRYLYNRYGSTSGIALIYDTDLLSDMLDPSGGAGKFAKNLSRYSKYKSKARLNRISMVKSVRQNLNAKLSAKMTNHDIKRYYPHLKNLHGGRPLSNNSWIRFGQLNRGKFTKSRYGDNYMKEKIKQYNEWKR
jgi:RHS repeat-associated protein